MDKKPVHLSTREVQILSMLSNGDTYVEIQAYFGITLSSVHMACCYLRRKTGIQQTRDQDECQKHLARLPRQLVADAINPMARSSTTKPLTPGQMDVFRLLAIGRTYPQIATFLGITSQSAQNLACRGAKRAGIIHAGWNRTRYIKEWLKKHDESDPNLRRPDPMDDPMF